MNMRYIEDSLDMIVMPNINRNITIDRAERYHDDKQLDQYTLPALNSDRAERNKKDLFYVPGQPLGWVVVGGLILYTPNLLALIFWLEFIPISVLILFSVLLGGLAGVGTWVNVPAKKLVILGLILGLVSTGVQYHHEPLSTIKEEIWTQKQK